MGARQILPKPTRAEFLSIAEQRYARILSSGQTTAWREMRRYLHARLSGACATRPAARKTSGFPR